MTNFLRKLLKTPVAWIILGLAFAAFAITGVSSPFGSPSPSSETVARVGNTDIDGGRLSNQFDRRLQAVRAEQPDFTTEEALQQGALSATLDQMVVATALQEFGERLGLGVSKRLVDAEIASVDAFKGVTGRFDQDAFRALLEREGINEKELRADFAGDIIRKHLLSVAAAVSPVPEGVAEPFAKLQLEQRTLRVGAVPFTSFTIDEPDAAALNAFYQERINLFTIPERRRIRYAPFERGQIAESVKPTEKEMRDYYDAHRSDYAATEVRTLRQVVTQDEGLATRIAARVKGGEDFAAVAKEALDYSDQDLQLGSLSEEDLANTTGEAVAEAAFQADKGETVGPIQSDFGYHVVKVDEVQRSEAKPFEAVKAEIEQRAKSDLIEERVAELVDKAQDAVDDGASVAEIAKELGLKLETLPTVTEDGRAPNAPDFQPSPGQSAVIRVAYEMIDGDAPLLEDIGGNNYALVSLEEILPAAPQPLAEVEEQVRAIYRIDQQGRMAAEKAQAIVAAVEGGESLNDALQAAGYPPAQELSARRVELASQQGQLPAYITQGFVQPEGAVAAVPLPQQGVVTIVQTANVVPGDLSAAPSFLQTVAAQMRSAQQAELQLAFARAVTDYIGVERFPEALAQVEAGYRRSSADVN